MSRIFKHVPFSLGCTPAGMHKIAVLSLVLALVSATVFADWSRFRGPNGSGVSDAKTIPTEWTEDDYNWATNLPGEGHGSPVIVGDKIFILCGDQYTAARRIVRINAEDGKIQWVKTFKSAPHYVHRDNNYASSTPVADEKGVVTTWTTPRTFVITALDNDGEQMWQRDLGEYLASWGGAPSPIIVDDQVIIMSDQMDPQYQEAFLPEGSNITEPGDSYAIALDRNTGETNWKIDRVTVVAGYATPCVRELDNGKKEIVFIGSGNGITGVDPKTGETNWELRDALPARTVMSPLLMNGLIVGSSGGGTIGDQLVAVRPPHGDKEAEVVFQIKQSIPLVPMAVYNDGLLFLTCENGYISCVDAETGEYYWRERGRGKFMASPIIIDNRLFCIDRRGKIIVLAADKEFQELARNIMDDDCFATPAVAHGTLYIRTASQLISIGGEK
jgi:outer membrane protein assembly factor BamB